MPHAWARITGTIPAAAAAAAWSVRPCLRGHQPRNVQPLTRSSSTKLNRKRPLCPPPPSKHNTANNGVCGKLLVVIHGQVASLRQDWVGHSPPPLPLGQDNARPAASPVCAYRK